MPAFYAGSLIRGKASEGLDYGKLSPAYFFDSTSKLNNYTVFFHRRPLPSPRCVYTRAFCL